MTATYFALPAWKSGISFSVLSFLPFEYRLMVCSFSKEWASFFQSDIYAKFLCERIHEECYLYVPPRMAKVLHSYWYLFSNHLWPLRNLFTLKPNSAVRTGRDAGEFHSSEIKVILRFRPTAQLPTEDDEEHTRKKCLFLPLHQRLQLIRARQSTPSQSIHKTGEALKTLIEEEGWFSSSWKKSKSDSTMASLEEKSDGFCSMEAQVHSIDSEQGRVITMAPGVGLREFSFDAVLSQNTSQSTVFEAAALRLLTDFMNGFNATIICFGQTGSGKTYTMFGESSFGDNKQENCGLVSRTAEAAIHGAEQRRQQGLDMCISVSYVEIFGDEVSDLLKDGARCGHSKVASQRYVLSGAAKQPIHNTADLHAALKMGDANKRRAATKMNARSTRAHALFIMTLLSRNRVNDREVQSQLTFVDLGGSEQVKRSEVHHGTMTEHTGHVLGGQMRETVNINLGLLALKKCIEALRTGSLYVPYQDSKLTMLLSRGLGGNSKTSVIICGSLDKENAKETVQTLRFGEACSRVSNDTSHQVVDAAGLIRSLDAEMAVLEQTIQSKERWEVEETNRPDINAEEGSIEAVQAVNQGGEIVRVGKVVGAEKERILLEALIIKRAKLLGQDPNFQLAEAGFGGLFAESSIVKPLGGNSEMRFQDQSNVGLLMKGKKVANWQT